VTSVAPRKLLPSGRAPGGQDAEGTARTAGKSDAARAQNSRYGVAVMACAPVGAIQFANPGSKIGKLFFSVKIFGCENV
jgi:hypothetical protein